MKTIYLISPFTNIDFLQIALLAGASLAGYIFSTSKLFSSRVQSNLNNENKDGLEDFDPEKDEFIYADEEIGTSLPEELHSLLMCSLDYSGLKTPVIAPFGFTYEKDTILNWLEKKNECPYTKQPLYQKDLRVNRNVLDLIKFLVLKERYNKQNPDNKIEFTEILH